MTSQWEDVKTYASRLLNAITSPGTLQLAQEEHVGCWTTADHLKSVLTVSQGRQEQLMLMTASQAPQPLKPHKLQHQETQLPQPLHQQQPTGGNNSSYHGSCKLQALNSNCLTAEVYWTIMSRIHGFPPTSPFHQASSSFAVTITVSPASKDSGKPAHSLFLAFALCLKFTLPPARFSFLPNNNHLTLGQ